jgi:tryptophanyl-tRNA synthetase
MTKPTILTGIRANNDLTIGNYFGGMLPIIDMARQHSDDYNINMFIPDLHSFTTPIDHSSLNQQILQAARLFVAAGLPLDNPSIHLYRQSYIPAHSEMTVLLNNFVGFGEMERMTQFKDKSAKLSGDRVSVGLFDYPVLMASDILLYDTSYVPVGEDQTQHIEITRDIAMRINAKFGNILTVPKSVADQHKFFGKDQGLRIKDLADPSKKMSKSDETGKGVIFLSDSPEAARKKIMSATTDDRASLKYDKTNQPGISNLIDILALLRGDTPQSVEAQFKGTDRYGDFKQVVASEVEQFLTDFRTNLSKVDDALVLQKLVSSEREVSQVANQTLLRVQKAVGLRA